MTYVPRQKIQTKPRYYAYAPLVAGLLALGVLIYLGTQGLAGMLAFLDTLDTLSKGA